jgi:hypothetical protein
MTRCTFTATDSPPRDDGKREFACIRCGNPRWSKYGPELQTRACGVAVDPTWPCVNRGEELRREECPSCKGTVQVKVLACVVYVECQVNGKLPAVKLCSGCADRKPST